MTPFERDYEIWMNHQIESETNPRRLERLKKGLGHGTVELLRLWHATVGHFNDLYAEWEVRDFNNGYRYLDLAYRPWEEKGGIEIQGYGPHARDLDVRRFKDLCLRHSLLTLDGWSFLLIAYPSIIEEPKQCQQLILSFIGKFVASDAPSSLNWLQAEILRFARRLPRPFTPLEIAGHLRVSDRHSRRLLHELVELQLLQVASGTQRNRSYILRSGNLESQSVKRGGHSLNVMK